MTQGELDDLKVKHRMNDTSASSLDFAIIYYLAKKCYTRDANREFWRRPSCRLYREDKEAKKQRTQTTSMPAMTKRSDTFKTTNSSAK
jgi:hypothetical protein